MMRLQLTVPTTATVENPNAITSPRQLAEWVKDLPYANPQVTARLLLDSLHLLVRQPGSLPQLGQLMHHYLPPFRSLLDAVVKSARRQQNIAGHRSEVQLQELFAEITTEMSYGFKRVILDNDLAGKGKLSDEETAESLYYAIDSLCLELMFSYAGYLQASTNVWREVSQLFLLAEQRKVARMPVETRHCDEEINTDIRLIFKRITLIHLLDPYRLQRGEVWAYYDYLACWAQHARVGNLKEKNIPASCFLLDLHGNQKPFAYDPEKPPGDPSHYLVLDVSPLNQEIHRQMQVLKAKPNTPIAGVSKRAGGSTERMIRNMLLAWHVQPHRRHPREERFDWLIAACGIAATQHFLLEGKLTAVTHEPEAVAEPGEETEAIEILDLQQTGPSGYDTQRWRQVNLSASGVGIVLNPADAGGLQVGQAVLLESERRGGEGSWVIGIVRRLIQRDRSTLETGIQFIRGTIHPATIRPEVFGTQDSADLQPALLLDAGDEHPEVLLTPHLIYHKGREYVVEDHAGKTIRVTANGLVESTLCFDRFEYSKVSLHG
ncbi:MAG: hypothetical protein ABW146_12625 [Candidatus Sedimenticola sp. 6PFRAG7]